MQKRKSNSRSVKVVSKAASGRFSSSAKRGTSNVNATKSTKSKLSLSEVADKLNGRELFSEKKENAKSFLNKLPSFPI